MSGGGDEATAPANYRYLRRRPRDVLHNNRRSPTPGGPTLSTFDDPLAPGSIRAAYGLELRLKCLLPAWPTFGYDNEELAWSLPIAETTPFPCPLPLP